MTLKLAVVTAAINPEKTREFWTSWRQSAEKAYTQYTVINGGPLALTEPDVYLFSPTVIGPVPAFTWGVERAVADGAELIACFHDDLRIDMTGWDTAVEKFFRRRPEVLLAGFGGGIGLGREGMYDAGVPYDPMSLARHDFVSNMENAEAHGTRASTPVRVACLDGFSMIGRAAWFLGAWRYLRSKGVVHHAYDSWMGALCKRAGGFAYMLPVACHHAGGRTAVANVEYQNWAREKNGAGDAGFWEASHKLMYEDCRDVLPFRAEYGG